MSMASEPTTSETDPFKLQRFVSAQEPVYDMVLAELRRGQKRTHWMWFIFPQLAGLGYSATSQHYAIKSKTEAHAYLSHPILGSRLVACAETVLGIQGRSAAAIFGAPDDMKLHSSMTLFDAITAPESVFAQVLAHYFGNKPDNKTLALLETPNS